MNSKHYILFFAAFLLLITLGFLSDNDDNISENPTDIVPCELFTSEQVSTVLPGHDEGFTAKSGGSLMKGVDSYQCSYTNDNTDLFTVIVHVAANEERFSWIKPDLTLGTKIKLGDGGCLISESDELKLEASKGLKVIELDLIAPGAKEKSDALIKLASVLLEKI